MIFIRFSHAKINGLRALLLSLHVILPIACEHTMSPDSTPTPADSLAILRAAFDAPEDCAQCHPNHYEEWRVSMHAYAFTDPIFFALNDIGQARSNGELDQFCVKCHSPLASLLLETPVGFNRASVSDIAKKGIHCDVCHAIDTAERGKGITSFRLDRVKQGPIIAPWANSYHDSQYDRRYDKSGICEGCHDVFNPQGVQVEFTQTEWDESPYASMGLECQGCHMPVYTGPAATGGPQRIVHRHTFVGVDVPLIDFPGRENTIAQVDSLLKNAVTMTVEAPFQTTSNQILAIKVDVTNDKTGHDIPSGTTFERQMWLEVIVRHSASQQVIYSSGMLDGNGDLRNHHSQEVAEGTVQPDEDLVLFRGVAKRNGEEIPFFWEADEVENRTIRADATVNAQFTLDAPLDPGDYQLTVRLRFRAFPPYFLRMIGQDELLDEMPVFDMSSYSQQIDVSR